MNIQRFSGSNSREAMLKVKAALGDGALIIANRVTDAGIEIIAAPDDDIPEAPPLEGPLTTAQENAFEAPGPERMTFRPMGEAEEASGDTPVGDEFAAFVEAWTQKPDSPAADDEPMAMEEGVVTPIAANAIESAETVEPAARAPSAAPAASPELNERLMAEVRDVKQLLKTTTARQQSSDSNGGRIYRMLLSACFSEELASELSLEFPEQLQQMPWDAAPVRDWLVRQINLRLPAPAAGEAMVDAGGVFALVGPTGSGKTTTTAKIAAQHVMRCGAESLALVSTDYYRIGAHEQLREYANLLNVTFRAVESGESLASVLRELGDKRLVLIDTVGLSQRDERVLAQFEELSEACGDLTFFLLLAGSSHQETLEEVVRSYRQAAGAAGRDVEYCILTKLDEAFSPALLLDKVICHDLRPVFTTSGQRVPEDIDMPELPRLVTPLVDRMLVDGERLTADIATRPADWTRHLLSRGRQIHVTMRQLREAVPCVQRLEALWDISLLQPDWQQARVNELASRSLALQLLRPTFVWSEAADADDGDGIAWRCPHLLLDADLQPTAGTVLQVDEGTHDPAGIEAQFMCRTHLFPDLPDAPTLRWLRDERHTWAAQVPKRGTIIIGGDAQSIARVDSVGETAESFAVTCRSQAATLELKRLPCVFEVSDEQGTQQFSGVAWSAVARCDSTGSVLQRRYWLASGEQGVAPLLRAHLATDSYAALVKHAMQTLDDMPGFRDCHDLRVQVASALASTALRIELSGEPADLELREQLMAVLGGKRACSARSLVDALSYLFIARELLVPSRTN